jgi:hypothetical protein
LVIFQLSTELKLDSIQFAQFFGEFTGEFFAIFSMITQVRRTRPAASRGDI